MHKAVHDWMIFLLLFLFVFVFVFMAQARAGVITGNVIGFLAPAPTCQSFSNFERVSVGSNLNLCGNSVHSTDFFVLQADNVFIQCNGSTLHGKGGSLFVSQVPRARVTLKNCVVEGFDGLYQNANPIDVRIE